MHTFPRYGRNRGSNHFHFLRLIFYYVRTGNVCVSKRGTLTVKQVRSAQRVVNCRCSNRKVLLFHNIHTENQKVKTLNYTEIAKS